MADSNLEKNTPYLQDQYNVGWGHVVKPASRSIIDDLTKRGIPADIANKADLIFVGGSTFTVSEVI